MKGTFPLSLTRLVALLLVACAVLIAVVNEDCLAAHATNEAPIQSASVTNAAVMSALGASFGTALEAVTAFKPFYLTGDFNGDAIQDIVTVVRY